MDPNTTYENLLHGIAVDDTEAVSEAAENLSAWIDRGGFLPDELESIAVHLFSLARDYGSEADGIDFRFYLLESGDLRPAFGDASYDPDHRGYCGAGSVAADSTLDDCRKAVAACLNDAVEFYFCGR
jgi:hypothetical protein